MNTRFDLFDRVEVKEADGVLYAAIRAIRGDGTHELCTEPYINKEGKLVAMMPYIVTKDELYKMQNAPLKYSNGTIVTINGTNEKGVIVDRTTYHRETKDALSVTIILNVYHAYNVMLLTGERANKIIECTEKSVELHQEPVYCPHPATMAEKGKPYLTPKQLMEVYDAVNNTLSSREKLFNYSHHGFFVYDENGRHQIAGTLDGINTQLLNGHLVTLEIETVFLHGLGEEAEEYLLDLGFYEWPTDVLGDTSNCERRFGIRCEPKPQPEVHERPTDNGWWWQWQHDFRWSARMVDARDYPAMPKGHYVDASLHPLPTFDPTLRDQ